MTDVTLRATPIIAGALLVRQNRLEEDPLKPVRPAPENRVCRGPVVAALALALAAGCSHQAGPTASPSAHTTVSAPPSCGMNQILLYPSGCKPTPTPFCSAVPPPIYAPVCGCDGQTLGMATAPWAHEGECEGHGLSGGGGPVRPPAKAQ